MSESSTKPASTPTADEAQPTAPQQAPSAPSTAPLRLPSAHTGQTPLSTIAKSADGEEALIYANILIPTGSPRGEIEVPSPHKKLILSIDDRVKGRERKWFYLAAQL